MINIRRTADRGFADHGWLQARHSFSFAGYHDPRHMGFRALRVINEDRIAPDSGFGTHPHRDMEIITWPLSGTLEHRDSMGGGGLLSAGDAQWMSAGTGLTHSEFNPSKDTPVHLLQIWLQPERKGGEPAYDQRHFEDAELRNRWAVIAAPDGRDGSLPIRQDAVLCATRLDTGRATTISYGPERHGWLQVARGSADISGEILEQGDGLAVSGILSLTIEATQEAEILAFDLA